uniref:Radical SAM protein n=1 Tax=Desulfobacca acetoxidans TaxID=60893 RepID=A0A7V4G869_9BACT
MTGAGCVCSLPPGSSPLNIKAIEHVSINVKDIRKSLDFYGRILGFQQQQTVDCGSFDITYFALPNGQRLELFDYHGSSPSTPRPESEAGLRHLNISLDTLNRERYQEITGKDALPRVLQGLGRALELGFKPLKVNCVVLKGINDEEVLKFAELARAHPLEVRFIEFMPTVSRARWAHRFFPMDEVRRRLASLEPLAELSSPATAGPARLFRPAGFVGTLGFISAMSEHHCGTCNRLRLTAAGRLRPCLFAPREIDLKTPLRAGADDETLGRLFLEAMEAKTCEPPSLLVSSAGSGNPMISIGG